MLPLLDWLCNIFIFSFLFSIFNSFCTIFEVYSNLSINIWISAFMYLISKMFFSFYFLFLEFILSLLYFFYYHLSPRALFHLHSPPSLFFIHIHHHTIFSGTTQWFDICIYCKMIIAISPGSLHHYTWSHSFVPCDENFSDFLSQQLSCVSPAALTVAAMLRGTSHDLAVL